MNIIMILLSIWSWFCLVFFTIFYVTSGVFFGIPLSYVIDRGTLHTLHRIAVLWAKSAMATSPFWRLKVEGQKNIQPGKHYIVICNHQSMLDILAALAGLPLHFKFMAKKELFSIPFLGWHMTFAGYIPINRNSPQSGKEALGRAKEWLGRKVSVLFFPEGTRSLDGEIKKFKAGAFRAAQEQGAEILPLVMQGTGEALPKKSWLMKKITHITLSVGKPVRIEKDADVDAAIEAIRAEMVKRLEGIRSR